jgi:hypothetical protein
MKMLICKAHDSVIVAGMYIKNIPYMSFFMGLLTAVSASYFISENFRVNISNVGIDVTLVTGLITSFALLASIINNKAVINQYTRERNFTYRMSVKETFEEMSLIAISKLYSIDARRKVCLKTMENRKKGDSHHCFGKKGTVTIVLWKKGDSHHCFEKSVV